MNDYIKNRNETIEYAREMVRRDCIVIDTETTGLNGTVFEFAAVRAGSLTPVCSLLSDTEESTWSAEARDMHASRLFDLSEFGVFPARAASFVRRVVQCGNVFTYNAEFDRAAIERTWPNITSGSVFTCLMRLYAEMLPYEEKDGVLKPAKWRKLEKALEECGIEAPSIPAHTALGDAMRAALLLRAIADMKLDGEGYTI